MSIAIYTKYDKGKNKEEENFMIVVIQIFGNLSIILINRENFRKYFHIKN